jgi:Fe-S cluster assembly iron-binding protein IscA
LTGVSFNVTDQTATGFNATGGTAIFLYNDPTNPDIVYGIIGDRGEGPLTTDELETLAAAGDIAFALFLDINFTSSSTAEGQLWVVELNPLENPIQTNDDDVLNLAGLLNISASEQSTFSFVGAPSGQNLFLAGENDQGTIQLVVTGLDPNPAQLSMGGTVNSSQASKFADSTLGSGSQAVNPGEGLVLTFVTGMKSDFVIPNLSQTEADVEANIDFTHVFDASGASFIMAQVTPNKKDVSLKLTTFTTDAEPGVGDGDTNEGFTAGYADDEQVNIDTVTVVDKDGNPAAGVMITITDGMALIQGLEAGDMVTYTTDGDHNRLEIVNPDTGETGFDGDSFDIGDFSLLKTGSGNQVFGAEIRFEDDGPDVEISANTGVMVTHDETEGLQNGGVGELDGDDVAATTSVTSGNVEIQSLFSGVMNPGDDLDVAGTDAIGFARSTSSLVTLDTQDFGVDGAATSNSTVYAFVDPAGAPAGVRTTEDQDIFLFLENGLIVGRYESDGSAGQVDINDDAAFALAIDPETGEIFVVQYVSLEQLTPGTGTSPVDSHDEPIALTDSSVQVAVTITDGDGDTDTSTASVGAQIKFDDDGPTAAINETGTMVLHDETPGVDLLSDDQDPPVPAIFPAGAIGWAQSSGAVVDAVGTDFGSDGAAALNDTVFSLSVAGGGVGSGLFALNGQEISLFDNGGGVIVGRVDNAGTPDPAGTIAIAIIIDSTTGVLSVAQYIPIKHPDGDNPDDVVAMTDSALQVVVTVTDGDGDSDDTSVDIGDAVKIRDDGPSNSGGMFDTVEEDDLTAANSGGNSIGNNQNDSVDAHISLDLDLTLFIDDGVDTPASFALVGAAGPALTSRGETVVYDVDVTGSLLTAYVEVGGDPTGFDSGTDREVFTWQVTAVGLATLTLKDQLDHDIVAGENLLPVNLTAFLEVRDADGDLVTLASDFADYTVRDDIPILGDTDGDGVKEMGEGIENGIITWAIGNSVIKSLGESIGTDEDDSTDGSTTIITVFTDHATLSEDLSADMQVLTYYDDSIGTMGGVLEAGEEVFRLTVDKEGLNDGLYTFEALADPPPVLIEFSFVGAPSGQNLFLAGENDQGTIQLVVTGLDPNPAQLSMGGTVNSSQASKFADSTLGSGNQAVNPGEGLVLTFVTGMESDFVIPNLSQTEADVEANIDFTHVFGASSASFIMAQVTPNKEDVNLKLTAFTTDAEPGVGFVAGIGDFDDVQVNIDSVKVIDKDSVTRIEFSAATGSSTLNGVTVDLTGNMALIEGLLAGDVVTYTTDVDHNRLEIVNPDTGEDGFDGDSFDIGDFSLFETLVTDDQGLNFTVKITDFDGDMDSESFSVGIDGTDADSTVMFPFNGDAEYLVSLVGADTLTGGDGADIFVYTSLADGVDTITDFNAVNVAGDDDILELSELFADGTVNSGNVDSFVQVSGGTLSVDTGGTGTFATDLATLTGVGAGDVLQVSIDGEDLTITAVV